MLKLNFKYLRWTEAVLCKMQMFYLWIHRTTVVFTGQSDVILLFIQNSFFSLNRGKNLKRTPPLPNNGKIKEINYSRSIKLCFLQRQTTAALCLATHVWSRFHLFWLACRENVMTSRHQNKCINYWNDLVILKALAFQHFSAAQQRMSPSSLGRLISNLITA